MFKFFISLEEEGNMVLGETSLVGTHGQKHNTRINIRDVYVVCVVVYCYEKGDSCRTCRETEGTE